MDGMREVEIDVLREVIEAVEQRARRVEAAGRVVGASRAQLYAAYIYAVLASARTSGHYGAGSLVCAPVLDAILEGAEPGPWEWATREMAAEYALEW